MLHVIDHRGIGGGAILSAMFDARKRVFVDLLSLDVPVLGGSWELRCRFAGAGSTVNAPRVSGAFFSAM